MCGCMTVLVRNKLEDSSGRRTVLQIGHSWGETKESEQWHIVCRMPSQQSAPGFCSWELNLRALLTPRPLLEKKICSTWE